MINFDFKHTHPKYRDLIVESMEALSEVFPLAPLKKVLVYPPEPAKNCETCANRSLGDATEIGTIRLNGYWFSESPRVLHEAGKVDDFVPGSTSLRWHGGLPQPSQVLVHEFFHVLRDGLGPKAEKFSHEMWMEVTKDPSLAFSGYSLYNPSEWWAENGAAYVLGFHKCPQVKELENFLTKSLTTDKLPQFDPNKHPRDPDGHFRKGR